MTPVVTIGIPTFARPQLLARALDSVRAQDYPNLRVLVADNATPGDASRAVVERFKGVLPGLAFLRHDQNIGALANFQFLLDRAVGPYFMWLADDDEISPTYVSTLVGMLEADQDAACAAGHWCLMRDERTDQDMPTSSFPQRSAVVRALRFIWRSDDSLFYALHRTDVLRAASFRGYWRPDRWGFQNWAYVYLLDVVLRGKVLLATDPTVRFINHEYTAKTYRPPGTPPRRALDRAGRRLNVHYLFWEKCARVLNPAAMPFVVATSLLSMAREGSAVAAGRLARSIREGIRRA